MRSPFWHSSVLSVFLTFAIWHASSCSKDKGRPELPPVIPPPAYVDSLPAIYRNCPNWICLTGSSVQHTLHGTLPNMGAFGAAVAVGRKSFFAGGHGEGDYPLGDLFGSVNVLDEQMNATYLPLSEARSHLSAAYAGTKVLFAGGCDAMTFKQEGENFFDAVDILDADDPSKPLVTSKLSERKAYMASASLNGKAYFMGGRTEAGYSAKMEVFDAGTSGWSIIHMPVARSHASASVHGSSIYLCGGRNGPGSAVMTVDIYDQVSGIWRSLTCPHAHPIASSAVLRGKLYIAGGNGNEGYIDILDIATGQWNSLEASDNRSHIAMAATEEALVMFGGDFSNHVDIYHVESDQWDHATLNDGVSGAVVTVRGSAIIVAGYLFGKGFWIGPMYMMIML